MLDLMLGAQSVGIQAKGVRLKWEELLSLETPAVLYVSGNHFCCVDPREKGEGENLNKVRVHDWPDPARWWDREGLESVWKGEALLIRPPEQLTPAQGPRAQFDTLLVDFGTIDADAETKHLFNLRNVGTEPLEIKEIRKSCGCADATPTRSVLAPGEAAGVELTVGVSGRHGRRVCVAEVVTNDPVNHEILLMYIGMAGKRAWISRDLVDFGDLIPGQSATREIIIADRDDGTLGLKRARVVFSPPDAGNEHRTGTTKKAQPEVRVWWEDYDGVSPAGERPQSRYFQVAGSETPSFRVILEASVPSAAQHGLFEGTLQLTTNDPKGKEISVPVRLTVAGDYYVSPPKVFFGILRPGETVARTISLKRRSSKKVELIDCRPKRGSLGVLPTARVIEGSDQEAVVELSLSLPQTIPAEETGIVKGLIDLHTDMDPGCELEWVCVPKY